MKTTSHVCTPVCVFVCVCVAHSPVLISPLHPYQTHLISPMYPFSTITSHPPANSKKRQTVPGSTLPSPQGRKELPGHREAGTRSAGLCTKWLILESQEEGAGKKSCKKDLGRHRWRPAERGAQTEGPRHGHPGSHPPSTPQAQSLELKQSSMPEAMKRKRKMESFIMVS